MKYKKNIYVCSVSEIPGYRMDDWDLIPSQGSNFSLCYHIHAGSGTRPVSIHKVPGQSTHSVKLYLNCLICPQDMTLNKVCVYMYTNTCSHMNACMCMRVHTHTHTHTYTHTHTVHISGISFTLGVRIA
jgi:hypothetical protein